MRGAIALIALVAAGHAAAEPVEPINDWKMLRARIARCWIVPAGTADSLVAMSFGLAPDGRLKGAPLIDTRHFPGGSDAGRRYLAAANETLERCQPFPLTSSFRAMQGNSVVKLVLANRPWEPSRNLGTYMTIFAAEAGGRE